MSNSSVRSSAILLAVFSLSSIASATGQPIIHVDADAPGTIQDGSSWATAFLDVQDAIDAAVAGAEIRIADGVYRPDRGTGERNASFHLVRDGQHLGGFAGYGAADPDARDPAQFETILSGDLADDDGANFANTSENSYHVVSNLDPLTTLATVIDGLTITGGNANGILADKTDQGSGLHNHWGVPDFTGRVTVTNCLFENNWAANHGAVNDHGGIAMSGCVLRDNHAGQWGGALYIHGGIETTVADCQFIGNTTDGDLGGGGAVTVESDALFTNCLFQGNYSDENGGGVYMHDSASPTFVDCTFDNNSTWNHGGGVYVALSDPRSHPTFLRCDFLSNTAIGTERSINGSGGGGYFHSHGTFTDCNIVGNVCERYGGGLTFTRGIHTLRSCAFIGNEAGASGGGLRHVGTGVVVDCLFDGNSAMFYGGGIELNGTTHEAVLINSVLRNNTASIGGGLKITTGTTDIVNCVFGGNIASNLGGGIAILNFSDVNVVNTTLVGNVASAGEGSALAAHNYYPDDPGTVNVTNTILWDEGDSIVVSAGTGDPLLEVTVAYSNVANGWAGAGNLSVTPDFLDADGPDDIPFNADDDLRLGATSLCIDAGITAALPSDVTDLDEDGDVDEILPVDLLGNSRVMDGQVDMGAIEGPFFDSDDDGVPDATDTCPGFDDYADADGDSLADGCDNCPAHDNVDQLDCDDDGLGDICAIAGGASMDCNLNAMPDECDIDSGAFPDDDDNGIPDICEACIELGDCADFDADGIRDDGCVWSECIAGFCNQTAIPFGDMGGQFGECAADGTADNNDRSHALNCFADVGPSGAPPYPCDDATNALNVDTCGRFGTCAPDGVCDGNDAFCALNAFAGAATCACPGGTPAPASPAMNRVVAERANLRLEPERSRIRPRGTVEVVVALESASSDLRGYQLHVTATGGARGALELVDVSVEERKDHVFAGLARWHAFNVRTRQMVVGLDSAGIRTRPGGYLATFVFKASPDAAGQFLIDVLHDHADPAHRTFLFPTPAGAQIEVESVRPAVVEIVR